MDKKKIILPLLAVASAFSFAGCNHEEASIKVKFYDSTSEGENPATLFPGSYDLSELTNNGLSEFVPTKKGYEFFTWTLDKEGTQVFNPSTYTSNDGRILKVYAKWKELRKVTFYNGSNKVSTLYYDDLVNNEVTMPTPTKEGYKFVRWTVDADNTTEFDLSNYQYPSDSASINVFAQFEKIVNISFYNGSEQVSRALLSGLKDESLMLPIISKEGYSFSYWSLDEEGTSVFDYTSFTSTKDSVNVYAQWTAKPKVIYVSDTTKVGEFYLESIDNATIPTPTKEGYDFIGWVNTLGEAFTVDKNSTVTQTAYAKYEEKQKVEFYNGDNLVSTKYLEDLVDGDPLPTASKSTYTFVKWTYEDGSDFDVNYVTSSKKTIKVIAKFNKITSIRFMNGETEEIKILLSSLKDSTTSMPSVNKEGYDFT